MRVKSAAEVQLSMSPCVSGHSSVVHLPPVTLRRAFTEASEFDKLLNELLEMMKLRAWVADQNWVIGLEIAIDVSDHKRHTLLVIGTPATLRAV